MTGIKSNIKKKRNLKSIRVIKDIINIKIDKSIQDMKDIKDMKDMKGMVKINIKRIIGGANIIKIIKTEDVMIMIIVEKENSIINCLQKMIF
jgi:hypothetical protein